ncbi:hypothetical protein [Pseudomonas sp.]|uniref:hypothetical protein n=1 Tax=Pseudomonas sp. TaxID=306 RepID=UPI0029B7B6B6|nr:hypothetical protein [Pseudomonas sp.]MDX3744832.1 hypothetical protein [Pseudomonas sp.]HDS0956592.1 hypothetical protein [Pseudomonas putida]
MQLENYFALACGLGLLLGLAWFALYLLSWAWVWSWAWMDDSKPPKRNPLIEAVNKYRGLEPGQGICCKYGYQGKDGERKDGEGGFFYPFLALALGPLALLVAFKLYPVVLAAATALAVAHVARFARRHKKLFDKHIKDPEAHK